MGLHRIVMAEESVAEELLKLPEADAPHRRPGCERVPQGVATSRHRASPSRRRSSKDSAGMPRVLGRPGRRLRVQDNQGAARVIVQGHLAALGQVTRHISGPRFESVAAHQSKSGNFASAGCPIWPPAPVGRQTGRQPPRPAPLPAAVSEAGVPHPAHPRRACRSAKPPTPPLPGSLRRRPLAVDDAAFSGYDRP